MAERVVVVTVPGCHLCADALSVVGDVCADAGITWSEQDLFALDDEAVARWRDLVPVVVIDGEVSEVLHVNRSRLAEMVSRLA